ncbi:hypothetical protein Tco_0065978 [Tanacetum coccineum]
MLKAQRRGQTFNWETATYGKIYYDNLDFFTDFEADFPAIFYNDALTSNHNISSEPTVYIYNAVKTDFDFNISFSDSGDEDYTFICDKNLFAYKLILVNDLKPEPVNENVEINTELCSENIDIKPMDSVVCISNNTTPVEFDKYLEINHYEKSELSETRWRLNEKVVEAKSSKAFVASVNRVHILDVVRMTVDMRQALTDRIDDTEMGLDTADNLCFH